MERVNTESLTEEYFEDTTIRATNVVTTTVIGNPVEANTVEASTVVNYLPEDLGRLLKGRKLDLGLVLVNYRPAMIRRRKVDAGRLGNSGDRRREHSGSMRESIGRELPGKMGEEKVKPIISSLIYENVVGKGSEIKRRRRVKVRTRQREGEDRKVAAAVKKPASFTPEDSAPTVSTPATSRFNPFFRDLTFPVEGGHQPATTTQATTFLPSVPLPSSPLSPLPFSQFTDVSEFDAQLRRAISPIIKARQPNLVTSLPSQKTHTNSPQTLFLSDGPPSQQKATNPPKLISKTRGLPSPPQKTAKNPSQTLSLARVLPRRILFGSRATLKPTTGSSLAQAPQTPMETTKSFSSPQQFRPLSFFTPSFPTSPSSLPSSPPLPISPPSSNLPRRVLFGARTPSPAPSPVLSLPPSPPRPAHQRLASQRHSTFQPSSRQRVPSLTQSSDQERAVISTRPRQQSLGISQEPRTASFINIQTGSYTINTSL